MQCNVGWNADTKCGGVKQECGIQDPCTHEAWFAGFAASSVRETNSAIPIYLGEISKKSILVGGDF